MMSMFWNTASAVPRYQASSLTRWLAGRMSKLSLRSGRRKFQPRCRWRIRLCALYCVATPMRRMPEFSALEREVDDARLAAEEHRGLGAPVGQFHQPAAAPAGQHIGHGVARQGSGPAVLGHGVLPSVLCPSRMKYEVESGGKVTFAWAGFPCDGSGPAATAPMLPMPLPP
jgi:hypothetical protein